MACEVWSSDAGPCDAPEVERLVFLNPNIDAPPPLGLGVCAAHFAEWLTDHALTNAPRP